MKRILTLVAVLALVFGMTGMSLLGCTTAARNRTDNIRQNLPPVLERGNTCVKNIIESQPYPSITGRLAFKTPTLEQLADTSLANETDIQLIVDLHKDLAKCREQIVKDHINVNPGAIPILTQGWQESDVILADLITRKITYGEANKRRSAVVAGQRTKLQAQLDQVYRDLSAAHYAELQQVDEAVNALSQWSYQQQALRQSQQLINAVNRPVTTNCFRVGNSVQCTSY